MLLLTTLLSTALAGDPLADGVIVASSTLAVGAASATLIGSTVTTLHYRKCSGECADLLPGVSIWSSGILGGVAGGALAAHQRGRSTRAPIIAGLATGVIGASLFTVVNENGPYTLAPPLLFIGTFGVPIATGLAAGLSPEVTPTVLRTPDGDRVPAIAAHMRF